MAIITAPDTASTEPDRGPPRWPPAEPGWQVRPATGEAYRGQAGRY